MTAVFADGLSDRHAKAKSPSPWVCFSALDDLDRVIAGNRRRDLAAVVAGRVRIADDLSIRIANKNCDVAVSDPLGLERLSRPHLNYVRTFIAVAAQFAADSRADGTTVKFDTGLGSRFHREEEQHRYCEQQRQAFDHRDVSYALTDVRASALSLLIRQRRRFFAFLRCFLLQHFVDRQDLVHPLFRFFVVRVEFQCTSVITQSGCILP